LGWEERSLRRAEPAAGRNHPAAFLQPIGACRDDTS
jgi:hypothetical protein